jgi:tRNA (cytidine56-2'-O)-methyltransferase
MFMSSTTRVSKGSPTEMTILVLRLGHRYVRDDRATTHLFLAARALGADGAIYSGQRDPEVEESLRRVGSAWGGSFELSYTKNWNKTLQCYKSKEWKMIHLTMYGILLQNVISDIRSSLSNKIVVVGGPKVPKRIYELANWNVAVTNQPHSEISALGVFLHELLEGKELAKPFPDGQLEIVPLAKGKKVIRKGLSQGSGQRSISS